MLGWISAAGMGMGKLIYLCVPGNQVLRPAPDTPATEDSSSSRETDFRRG
jgi:hypothetical protein